VQEFVRSCDIRKDLDCENPEVVAEYVKARGVRCYGIKATCSRQDNPVARTEYFKVEYAVFGGVWELPEITPVSLAEIENLQAREPVEFADRAVVDKRLTLILAIPTAIVLILVFMWLRKGPGREYPIVRRLLRVPPRATKPHQKRSHDSITSIDHD
jgi:hypothetical protein